MSERPATIPRRRPVEATQAPDFAALRSEAIARVQALAGAQWTDFNLHDPGVTILEQYCYALTEIVYDAERPLADHLCGESGAIAFDRLGLHPPPQALPCRATTAEDLRRVLVDRVAGLADAGFQAAAPGGIALWRLAVELAPERRGETAAVLAAACAAYRHQRGLGEDLDDAVTLVRRRECQLQVHLDIGGARGVAAIVAEVYDRVARHVGGRPRRRSVDELLAEGWTAEAVWDGPVVHHGVLDAPAARAGDGKLFIADLAAVLRTIDGVRDVHRVALQVDDEADVRTHAVDWRTERGVLAVHTPGQGADLSRVQITRRGTAVHFDADDVIAEYADRQAAVDRKVADGPSSGHARRLPAGHPRAPRAYFSVQEQFPAVYGLWAAGGRHTPPRTAQLRAYLALFEQVMANGSAQLQHLRELFDVPGHSWRSYWWQVLGNDSVPGIEALYRDPRAQIEHDAFVPCEDAASRRLRALDTVLALHGQVYSQNTMRQFLGFLEPAELQARLVANKTAFALAVIEIGRDRASGFDHGEAAWDGADNVCGLQRSVGLLLGFADGSSRSLCAPYLRQRSEPVPADRAVAAGPLAVSPAERQALRGLERPLRARGAAAMRAELASLGLARGHLPAAWLRAGVDRTRYAWQAGPDAAGGRLLLGPDEDGHWWALGRFADEDAAAAAADSMRRWLLRLSDLGEGLHVVEHVLLRPRSQEAPQRSLGVGAAFHSLRVTVVFPGWTVRTHRPAFRSFAEETVQLNTPAHVAAQCLWLDFTAMQRFETAFEAWLATLRVAVNAPGDEGAANAADHAARAVIERLLAHGVSRD